MEQIGVSRLSRNILLGIFFELSQRGKHFFAHEAIKELFTALEGINNDKKYEEFCSMHKSHLSFQEQLNEDFDVLIDLKALTKASDGYILCSQINDLLYREKQMNFFLQEDIRIRGEIAHALVERIFPSQMQKQTVP